MTILDVWWEDHLILGSLLLLFLFSSSMSFSTICDPRGLSDEKQVISTSLLVWKMIFWVVPLLLLTMDSEENNGIQKSTTPNSMSAHPQILTSALVQV